MRGTFRVTDAVAALGLFAAPVVEPVETTSTRSALFQPATLPAADGTETLSERSRLSITDPLGRTRHDGVVGRPRRVTLPFQEGGRDAATTSQDAPAAQVDQTTCGSAVLTMLAMAGDTRVAAWVSRDPAARFDDLQLRVHRACARSGLLPWPQRFGTAPWAAAAVARYGSVRYTHRVVGDGERGAAVLRAAVAAAESGTPVPLFTGGDLDGGWQAAVPRHVVLLVDAYDDGAGHRVVRLYEPSSATIHTVPAGALLAPERVGADQRALLTPALGHWPHVVWAVLPR